MNSLEQPITQQHIRFGIQRMLLYTWIGFRTVTRLRTISTVKRFTENSNSQEIKMLKKVEKHTARKHANDVCSAVESSRQPIFCSAHQLERHVEFKIQIIQVICISAYGRKTVKIRYLCGGCEWNRAIGLHNKELTINIIMINWNYCSQSEYSPVWTWNEKVFKLIVGAWMCSVCSVNWQLWKFKVEKWWKLLWHWFAFRFFSIAKVYHSIMQVNWLAHCSLTLSPDHFSSSYSRHQVCV